LKAEKMVKIPTAHRGLLSEWDLFATTLKTFPWIYSSSQ